MPRRERGAVGRSMRPDELVFALARCSLYWPTSVEAVVVVFLGPYTGGASTQHPPLVMTWITPLITLRLSKPDLPPGYRSAARA